MAGQERDVPAGTSARGEAYDERRAELVRGAVEYLREQGLSRFTLRPLARSLGTSDRMLLYYFANRDELLVAALESVAAELLASFEASLPPAPATPGAVLAQVLASAGQPELETNLRLWVEVLAQAARGDVTCRETAARVLAGWVGWLAERIDVPDEERRQVAASLLAVIDGIALIYLAGDVEDAFSAAIWLAARLGEGRAS